MSDMFKKILVIVANIPPVLGLIAWPVLCMMSALLGDSSSTNLPTLCLMLAVLVYPVPVLAGIWHTYKALRQNDYARCVRGTLISYSCALFIGAMICIIMWFCDGKFAVC